MMEKHFGVDCLYQENKEINALRRIIHNEAYLISAYTILFNRIFLQNLVS
jgi:hypothetical protein